MIGNKRMVEGKEGDVRREEGGRGRRELGGRSKEEEG